MMFTGPALQRVVNKCMGDSTVELLSKDTPEITTPLY